MPSMSAPVRAGALSLGMALGSLSGCAVSSQTELNTTAGLSCIDDSVECISRRKTTLNALVDDPQRAWIKQPPTAEAYASGVRLFAYKKKKKELTCDELIHGRKEAEGAPAALKSAGTLFTPSQVARGRMLAAEVARELDVEFGKRCKKA